jgi:hypothetical protein
MPLKRLLPSILLSVALLFIAVSEGQAGPVTLPTNLVFGETYRLAFVTSTTSNSTSADIADYNAFVTSVANSVPDLAALSTTWTAIGSTATTDARDNTSTNPGAGAGVEIYLLNDSLLASGNADLWDGSIANSLAVNEQGILSASVGVWTGTGPIGTAAGIQTLGGADPFTVVGLSGAPTAAWIAGATAKPDTANLSFYAISGVLTAIPEPGTALLMGMGLAAMGWKGRSARS